MRITQAIINNIVKEESKNKFYDKLTELENNYRSEIEVEVKKTIPKYIKEDLVSDGWIKTSCDVKIDGLNDDDKYRYRLALKSYNSYPTRANIWQHEIKLTKKLESRISKYKKIFDERDDFKEQLRSVLFGYTTSKKLLADIPELQEYFKDDFSSKALVPVEDINRVRKLLKYKK